MQDPAASPVQPSAERYRAPQDMHAPFPPGAARAPSISYHYDAGTTGYRPVRRDRAERIAKALGWFSVGLGLAQLLAPRHVARAVGVDERPPVMRAIGMRELASGAGLLSQPRPANWI